MLTHIWTPVETRTSNGEYAVIGSLEEAIRHLEAFRAGSQNSVFSRAQQVCLAALADRTLIPVALSEFIWACRETAMPSPGKLQ